GYSEETNTLESQRRSPFGSPVRGDPKRSVRRHPWALRENNGAFVLQLLPAFDPFGAVQGNHVALTQDSASGCQFRQLNQFLGRPWRRSHHFFQVIAHKGAGEATDDGPAISGRDGHRQAEAWLEIPAWPGRSFCPPVSHLEFLRAESDEPAV